MVTVWDSRTHKLCRLFWPWTPKINGKKLGKKRKMQESRRVGKRETEKKTCPHPCVVGVKHKLLTLVQFIAFLCVILLAVTTNETLHASLPAVTKCFKKPWIYWEDTDKRYEKIFYIYNAKINLDIQLFLSRICVAFSWFIFNRWQGIIQVLYKEKKSGLTMEWKNLLYSTIKYSRTCTHYT